MSQTADTSWNLKLRFDRCRELRVEEAIVIAAIYAGAPEEECGKVQWHVVAAKEYLRSMPRAVVEKRILAEIKDGPSARSLVRTISEICK